MHRLAATTLLAALAVAGLSACGTLDGSAHAAVSVPVAAASTAAAASTETAAPTATAAPTETAAPAAADPAGAPAAPGQDGAPDPGPATGGGPDQGSGMNSEPAPEGNGGSPSGTGGGTWTGGSDGGGTPAPTPKVTSLRVKVKPSCPVHDMPGAPYSSPGNDVTIAWSVTGASGAALAVDQPGLYGAYGSDYPASGTLQLPFSCTPGQTTSHTYTIWPAGAHGVSKTITVSARSDG